MANSNVNAGKASSGSGSDTTELILNRVSMALLIAGGLFFIYEGSMLVEMHRDSPDKIPPKVAVAGSLTIFLGIISIAFAVLHLFFDGTFASYLKSMQEAAKSVKKNATNAGKGVANASTNAANAAARATANAR